MTWITNQASLTACTIFCLIHQCVLTFTHVHVRTCFFSKCLSLNHNSHKHACCIHLHVFIHNVLGVGPIKGTELADVVDMDITQLDHQQLFTKLFKDILSYRLDQQVFSRVRNIHVVMYMSIV